MINVVFGIFLVLHGLVHLLYFGQSRRLFELQPGMVWPEGSWVLSQLLSAQSIRTLAGAACILAALGMVAGAVGTWAQLPGRVPMILVAVAFSSALFVVFWDGALQNLDDKGAVGLLINGAILILALILQ